MDNLSWRACSIGLSTGTREPGYPWKPLYPGSKIVNGHPWPVKTRLFCQYTARVLPRAQLMMRASQSRRRTRCENWNWWLDLVHSPSCPTRIPPVDDGRRASLSPDTAADIYFSIETGTSVSARAALPAAVSASLWPCWISSVAPSSGHWTTHRNVI